MVDPNHPLSQVDPKLKEAYDRVMGTSMTPPAQTASASPQQPATPTININPNPHPINVGPTLQPIGARREPEKIQIGGTPGIQTHGYIAPKKKKGLPMPLLVVGGIIFLIVYTIFWLKFFQVPVPFLP